MRKGYTETLPKGTHDENGLPICGAPTPKEAKQSKREIDREETFRRLADKKVDFKQSLRTGGGAGRWDWINLEAMYRTFRDRMAEDEEFQKAAVDRAMDRIMAELFVPTNYSPGMKVPLHRRPKEGE